MESRRHTLKDGRTLLIREALPDDAPIILEYLAEIGGESDFLTFGLGEMEIGEEEERKIIGGFCEAENQLFLLGMIDNALVSMLTFSARNRPRIRHTGEFGMSVRNACWGIGVGSAMLDTLIEWGRASRIVAKINLHVRTDNHRAIRLYEQKGFVREGTISRGTYLNGVYFDQHSMGMEV